MRVTVSSTPQQRTLSLRQGWCWTPDHTAWPDPNPPLGFASENNRGKIITSQCRGRGALNCCCPDMGPLWDIPSCPVPFLGTTWPLCPPGTTTEETTSWPQDPSPGGKTKVSLWGRRHPRSSSQGHALWWWWWWGGGFALLVTGTTVCPGQLLLVPVAVGILRRTATLHSQKCPDLVTSPWFLHPRPSTPRSRRLGVASS